jgi:hypothetical protein
MGARIITLFNGLTGASTIVDAGGTGGGSSRSLNWEAEVSRWLKEANEQISPFDLKGLGLGILANFPTFLHGRGRESNAIGNNAPIQDFAGVDLFKVIQHTLQIGVGDNAETDFGSEALTQGDPAANNYGNVGSDGEAIPVPTGAATPAFVLSNADAFNLSATDGILTIIVDGVSYAVNVGTGGAATSEEVVSAILDTGVPVMAHHNAPSAGDEVLLTTAAIGASHTIQIDRSAGSAGAVIFPAAAATLRQGKGGPLNSLEAVSDGVRAQRRVLPGSISATDASVTGVDGTISSGNTGVIAGTGLTGTINYLTGVVDLDFTAAPASLAGVNVTFGALVPLVLSDQVKVPRSGLSVALILK